MIETNGKMLRCNYEKDVPGTPWACEICPVSVHDLTVTDKIWSECKKIVPVKEVYMEYPTILHAGGDFADVVWDKKIECIRDDVNDVLNCGEKHTLKFTQNKGLKVIDIPDDVELLDGDKLNSKLWAKKLLISGDVSNIRMQIFDNLLPDDFDDKHLFTLDDEGEKAIVTKIWKDDFSDEYDKIKTPIFPSTIEVTYQEEWKVDKALREWLANAFDVTASPKDIRIYKDKHNNWVIEYKTDSVLELKHLAVLGSHEEGFDARRTIGQFGEGITLGSLVFARNRIPIKIEAIGRTYYPVIERNPETDCNLLHFYYKPNKRKHGTKITIIGLDDKIVERVKNRFLQFRDDYKVLFEVEDRGQILEFRELEEEQEKTLAIRDLIVKKENMLFSYNLVNKTLQNRDRELTSDIRVRWEVAEIFKKLDKDQVDIIQKICETYEKTKGAGFNDLPQEYWKIPEDKIPIWREIADKIFLHRKVAITSRYRGREHRDKNLISLGYDIADWGRYGNYILEQLGYKYSDEIAESIGKPVVVDFDKLDNTQKENLEIAKNNLKLLMTKYYTLSEDYANNILEDIFVAESFEGVDEAEGTPQIEGLYLHLDDNIYIHKNALHSPVKATGVLIHEFLHKYGKVHDETREFENMLTDVSGYTGHNWAESLAQLDVLKQALNECLEKTRKPVLVNEEAIENKKLKWVEGKGWCDPVTLQPVEIVSGGKEK